MFTTCACAASRRRAIRSLTVTPGNKVDEILRWCSALCRNSEPDGAARLSTLPEGGDRRERPGSGLGQVDVVGDGRRGLSETWRELVAERVGATDLLRFSSSLYGGTADAGVLGRNADLHRHSLVSADKPEAAKALFGDRAAAHPLPIRSDLALFRGTWRELCCSPAITACRSSAIAIADRGGVLGFGRYR